LKINVKKIVVAAVILVISALAIIAVLDFNSSLEIEKKWVIAKDEIPYDLSNMERFEITQTYISYSPEVRVRKIVNDGITYYTTTTKEYVNDKGIVRKESESYITQQEYEEALENKLGNTIYKTRYQIEIDGHIYAFDIFNGDLNGLAYLEIEFDSEQEAIAFEEPSWVIKDVTNNRRYKNQELSKYGMPNVSK